MQVSVEESGVIERKLAICVPSDEIESEVSKRLHDAARKTRIPGFRPGKAPLRIIRQRFAPGITNEVVMETIQSSYDAALKEQEIVPAGLLSIDPVPYQSGNDLEFVATIEVFPSIPSLDLEGVTIRKPVVEVTAQDVDSTMEDIRLRHADNYTAREGKSEKGDRLTVDFEGKIDGESFEDGSAEGYSFILGNREMPEEFESGLVGVSKGEVTTILTTYPQFHDNPILAGKEVEYSITVQAIEQPQLPELNDEFAQKMGISEGGIEKLRQEVESNLSHELDDHLRGVMRHRVMNGLLQKNEKIEVPKSLVENEIDHSVKRIEQYMVVQGLPTGDINRDHYAAEAKRQVSLSLIVKAIIDQQVIQVGPEAVRLRVTEMAASYEQPEVFVAQFMANPDRVKRAEAVLFEERVVEVMLETATVEEEKLSLRDFMQETGNED